MSLKLSQSNPINMERTMCVNTVKERLPNGRSVQSKTIQNLQDVAVYKHTRNFWQISAGSFPSAFFSGNNQYDLEVLPSTVPEYLCV